MFDWTFGVVEAEILDTWDTEGFLCIEVEGKVIKAHISEEMIDLDEALPELVHELKKAGYVFYGEPTSKCGTVELIKVRF